MRDEFFPSGRSWRSIFGHRRLPGTQKVYQVSVPSLPENGVTRLIATKLSQDEKFRSGSSSGPAGGPCGLLLRSGGGIWGSRSGLGVRTLRGALRGLSSFRVLWGFRCLGNLGCFGGEGLRRLGCFGSGRLWSLGSFGGGGFGSGGLEGLGLRVLASTPSLPLPGPAT